MQETQCIFCLKMIILLLLSVMIWKWVQFFHFSDDEGNIISFKQSCFTWFTLLANIVSVAEMKKMSMDASCARFW